MAQQQMPAPLPPFRPNCIMCVSDCDPESVFTSCHHFICSRCLAKYPQGQCPRCAKPCRALRISAPNVAERISGDGNRVLQQAVAITDFQRRQEANTVVRLRELVTLFNSNHRAAVAQLQEARSNVERLKSENARLQQALEAAEQRLRNAQQDAVSPMPHFNQQALIGDAAHTANATCAAASQRHGGYPTRAVAGDAAAWMSPCRPPSAMGDVHSLFGTKRSRSETAGIPSSPMDRFILATPAVTLRGYQSEPPRQSSVNMGAPAPRLQSMLPAAPTVRLVHSTTTGGFKGP